MELAIALVVPATVVAGLGFEERLFAPSRAPRRGEAALWSIGWLLLACAVAAGIALTGGPAGEWTTVYLIERSLSLDNVFLFSLLLAYFLVPPELRGRVIVIGIAGALVLRGVAIAAGLALSESAEAVVYVFGVLLLYVAYRAFRGAPEQSDQSANPCCVSSGAPSRPPPTSAAAACSSAKKAASTAPRDPAVIWGANAFALLGLGSLLALVDILVRRFRYLGKTIALILAFVGIKILVADLVHITDLGSLAVVAALLAGGVVASLAADRLDPPHAADQTTRRPPRCPRELAPPAEATTPPVTRLRR